MQLNKMNAIYLNIFQENFWCSQAFCRKLIYNNSQNNNNDDNDDFVIRAIIVYYLQNILII